MEIPSAGGGSRIGYADGGTVTTGVVRADLASAASFTGTSVAGALGAAGSDNYPFTIREREMAGTPSGTVILRVATTGDVLPVTAGLEPMASAMSGGARGPPTGRPSWRD